MAYLKADITVTISAEVTDEEYDPARDYSLAELDEVTKRDLVHDLTEYFGGRVALGLDVQVSHSLVEHAEAAA